MPVVLIPYLVAIGLTATEAAIVADIIVMAALVCAEKLLMPKQKAAAGSANYPSQQMVKNSISTRAIAYGNTVVPGVIVYMQTTGNQNQYFDIVTVHTPHEIDSYSEFDVDNFRLQFPAGGNTANGEFDLNTGVFTSRYNGLVAVYPHLGVPDDTADGTLISNSAGAWNVNCTLSGCAYVYWRLTYEQNAFSGGVPNLGVVLNGKPVYDPRSNSVGWSDNAGLCVLDYMMDTTYGFRTALAEFDSGYLMTAINDCDDDILLNGGGSEKRYTINGVIDSASSPGQNLDAMLGAMAGQCPWVGGFFYLRAGTWQVPAGTPLTEVDLRKMPTLSTKMSMRDTINSGKGTYLDPNSRWQATDFPVYQNSAYISDDNNVIYWGDLQFALTTSPARAQRLAKIFVERTRAGQVTLKMPCKLTALRFQCGDNILVTLDRFGYTNQYFEVTGFEFVSEKDEQQIPCIGIDLTLRGTAQEAFEWNSGEEVPYEPSPVSTLPNPFIILNPTNLVLTSNSTTVVVAADGTIVPRLLVSWTPSTDAFVLSGGFYQIQYRVHGVSAWLDWDRVPGTQSFDYITNVVSGVQYDVRIRSVNSLPLANPNWLTNSAGTNIAGAPAAPSDVVSLQATAMPVAIRVDWDNPTDTNFGYTVVYISTVNDFSTATVWFIGLSTETTIPNLVSGTTLYIWAKPFNTSAIGGNLAGPVAATALDAVPGVIGGGTPALLPGTVTTAAIVPFGVTNSEAAQIASISLTQFAPVNFCTVTIQTVGGDVLVFGQIGASLPNTPLQLFRNGALIYSTQGASVVFIDDPGPGLITYNLRMTQTFSNHPVTVPDASIACLEVRR
jgi:hypothetical protein